MNPGETLKEIVSLAKRNTIADIKIEMLKRRETGILINHEVMSEILDDLRANSDK